MAAFKASSLARAVLVTQCKQMMYDSEMLALAYRFALLGGMTALEQEMGAKNKQGYMFARYEQLVAKVDYNRVQESAWMNEVFNMVYGFNY